MYCYVISYIYNVHKIECCLKSAVDSERHYIIDAEHYTISFTYADHKHKDDYNLNIIFIVNDEHFIITICLTVVCLVLLNAYLLTY